MRYDRAHWQAQRWEKSHRYYLAEVRQDIFGAWQLVRAWGGTPMHTVA